AGGGGRGRSGCRGRTRRTRSGGFAGRSERSPRRPVPSRASRVPASHYLPRPPRNGTRAAIRSGTASHTRQATPKIGVGRKKSILAIRLSHGVLKVLEVSGS